jgi:hypothetical protein
MLFARVLSKISSKHKSLGVGLLEAARRAMISASLVGKENLV